MLNWLIWEGLLPFVLILAFLAGVALADRGGKR